MTSPAPAYTITEPLSRGRGTDVYRAIRSTDDCPVILKVLDPRGSRPRDLDQLRREYEIGRFLDTPAVVRPLALVTYEGRAALVMEDFGGQSLDTILGAPMDVERFLALGVPLARAVRGRSTLISGHRPQGLEAPQHPRQHHHRRGEDRRLRPLVAAPARAAGLRCPPASSRAPCPTSRRSRRGD